MNKGRINEQLLTQGIHQPQDAISLGDKVLKVTVRAHPMSTNDVWIGWNVNPSAVNVLQPGESVTYDDWRVYLDGNALYVGFDPAGAGGMALVTFIFETDQKPTC